MPISIETNGMYSIPTWRIFSAVFISAVSGGIFRKTNTFKCLQKWQPFWRSCAAIRETPQGRPTSPVLSNLICEILDFRILKIAKHYKLDYTRYADDLTFSTNDKTFCSRYDAFYQQLQKEIRRAGFAVNEKRPGWSTGMRGKL